MQLRRKKDLLMLKGFIVQNLENSFILEIFFSLHSLYTKVSSAEDQISSSMQVNKKNLISFSVKEI